MTYSIVARDRETGELGVAVQTRWPFVGETVPWAQPGIGAVATQSFADRRYGPLGLERMAAGLPAAEALATLLTDDPEREIRQVGMVDAMGRSASYTGSRCVAAAGHVTLDDVAIQANMMERPTVWSAMAEAYRSAPGDLAHRLVAALRAAEAEGGDVRGRQSAALLVVPRNGPAWTTRFDLRADDHRAPLDELERLLRLARAYEAMDRSEAPMLAGDMAAAAEAMDEAYGLAPEDDQIALWTALAVGGAGDLERARRLFRAARTAEPRSAEHLRRFLAAGHLPGAAAGVIEQLEALP